MKLTFLGTAAAEGMPALWCECPTCAEAKKLGGKEIRRRCSYLLDGDTLIDFGPDAFWQSIEFNIDLTAIDRISLEFAARNGTAVLLAVTGEAAESEQ